jgi:hypothetical protein
MQVGTSSLDARGDFVWLLLLMLLLAPLPLLLLVLDSSVAVDWKGPFNMVRLVWQVTAMSRKGD